MYLAHCVEYRRFPCTWTGAAEGSYPARAYCLSMCRGKANPDKKPSWCSAGTWQRGYWCLLKSLTLEEKKIKKRMTAEAWPRMQARHFHSWILSSSYGLRKVSYLGNMKQLDRTVKCRSLYWGRQHQTDAHLLCSGASYWCHGVRTASRCFLFARSPGNCNS